MIRRLMIDWPERARPLSRPVRLLAVSDEREASLQSERNRDQLTPIDGILGAGDLEPDYVAFLADAFRVPLLYVRGNHDRGGGWEAGRSELPDPIDGARHEIEGVEIAGMSWPGQDDGQAVKDESAAWSQAVSVYFRARTSRVSPAVILTHVPPRSMGDTPEDYYHRGFAGYRWLCRSLRPVLWVHGHTSPAAVPDWRITSGPTTLVNVTGAVLIELRPVTANIDHQPGSRLSGQPAEVS